MLAVPGPAVSISPRPNLALAGIEIDPSWPKNVFVVTDSVMLGAKQTFTKRLPDWQVEFTGRPALMIRVALPDVRRLKSVGPVAIVALGYNSLWEKDRKNFDRWASQFEGDVETMMSALKERGAKKIVWVMLRELTPEQVPKGHGAMAQYKAYAWYFPYVNERLRAIKARHPEMALADWPSASQQGGLTYDAIHLNPRGAELFVSVVKVAMGLDVGALTPSARPTESVQLALNGPVPVTGVRTPSPPELPITPSLVATPASAAGDPGVIPAARSDYSLKDCATCPEMVVLPAASFIMGSPEAEPDREAGEGPQRRVAIRRPFAVGKYEVTFAEWDACVAAGGCKNNKQPEDEGWGRGKQPVINVSWTDATEYAAWLSAATGKPYRLLTEAEWEFAARGGTTTAFSTGGSITVDQANFQTPLGDDGVTREGTYREHPVAVGSFMPNAFGLFDMHGSVWEWVEDAWHDDYAGAPADGSVWGGGDMSQRVLRGGGWYSFMMDLRSASRKGDQLDHRSAEVGFRVARDL